MNDSCRKHPLRSHLLALRNGLAEERREAMDEAIAAAVLALPAYHTAQTICGYVSFGSEVSTRAILTRAWADAKRVVLPRCVPGTRLMRWYEAASLEALERSPMGIEEPPEDPAREVTVFDADCLSLVPGLTFDPEGYRMGYGGGFYDTFLADFPGVAVGLCRTTHLSKRVPHREAHDLAVDIVVTDGPVFLGTRNRDLVGLPQSDE